MTQYRLFGDFAHRYDLHTPAAHYRHDHDFLIELASPYGPQAKLLDVGCGTGVFIAKARAAGIDAYGIDSSAGMIEQCEKKLGSGVAWVQGMQELDAREQYDVISALSWTLHYARNAQEVEEILRRFRSALKPNGTMVLQLAHAAHASGKLMVDREAGPEGEPDDVALMYRFVPCGDAEASMRAEYIYLCWSRRELLHEDHTLALADAYRVRELALSAGFASVSILDSCRGAPFNQSLAPFLVAKMLHDV